MEIQLANPLYLVSDRSRQLPKAELKFKIWFLIKGNIVHHIYQDPPAIGPSLMVWKYWQQGQPEIQSSAGRTVWLLL